MSDPRPAALPRAHGKPVLAARLRSTPEDFFVEELAGFEPTGSGEHLLLTVEKRGMNTAWTAQRIAQWAGVEVAAIGYAGLKDRHAVTRQRFSVHLPRRNAPAVESLEYRGEGGEALRVLAHDWHAKKLPRGALAGNRFVLVLRGVTGERGVLDARLQAIAARGVPNYFGEQRFGRGGDNLHAALSMFAGRRVGREQRTHLLSAARSALFNRVLAARVATHCWDTPLDGEVWMLDGSRSVFGPEPHSDELARRLALFDIHPSGPLWGRGELRSRGDAATIELKALSEPPGDALRAGLERAGLKQERRALRLRPGGFEWSWQASDVLQLRFDLPPGTYATTVLAELGDLRDASFDPV
ncbi:tRNA pseudouridine(13) synthase TruD [Marilutibacter chinensis]|uniref:tRNA pseudouridine synthase D n=1 Tax=Marilutibacter chinensis TaxID=2912247 RepID=A0ABS9HSP7_9GAMM|nr:tRNA pseudouridine(13) synthase TruD [Lysobacter chinensis]MCF7221162.1 tRNA pseudouridine(13) synthase TruD [Lysobacter chinensis]MCF7223097.1 tRNA pseudouridine(13) synthase TruD [Lysobacter chinensis]